MQLQSKKGGARRVKKDETSEKMDSVPFAGKWRRPLPTQLPNETDTEVYFPDWNSILEAFTREVECQQRLGLIKDTRHIACLMPDDFRDLLEQAAFQSSKYSAGDYWKVEMMIFALREELYIDCIRTRVIDYLGNQTANVWVVYDPRAETQIEPPVMPRKLELIYHQPIEKLILILLSQFNPFGRCIDYPPTDADIKTEKLQRLIKLYVWLQYDKMLNSAASTQPDYLSKQPPVVDVNKLFVFMCDRLRECARYLADPLLLDALYEVPPIFPVLYNKAMRDLVQAEAFFFVEHTAQTRITASASYMAVGATLSARARLSGVRHHVERSWLSSVVDVPDLKQL